MVIVVVIIGMSLWSLLLSLTSLSLYLLSGIVSTLILLIVIRFASLAQEATLATCGLHMKVGHTYMQQKTTTTTTTTTTAKPWPKAKAVWPARVLATV